MARAKLAKTYADYFYAMQEYAASFNDDHVSYGVWGATPDEVRRWPGFITRYDSNDNQVAFVSEPWSGVPIGARLLSCDGRTADQVARSRVGSRFGRWDLRSQRVRLGAWTFLNAGNPNVPGIRRCRFATAGKTIKVQLKWRAPIGSLFQRYHLDQRPEKGTAEWRNLHDGTEWFSIPSERWVATLRAGSMTGSK